MVCLEASIGVSHNTTVGSIITPSLDNTSHVRGYDCGSITDSELSNCSGYEGGRPGGMPGARGA